MDEFEFWRLISRLDWSKAGDDEAVIEPLVAALVKRGLAAIEGFEDQLAEKLHALDTRNHARHIGWGTDIDGGGYFSDDLFLYVRTCAVANGMAFYRNALSSPSKMPADLDFETLLYAAQYAYERLTGGEWSYVAPVSYESFSNKAGWADE